MLSEKVNKMLVDLKNDIDKELTEVEQQGADSTMTMIIMERWYNAIEDILAEKE